jgi:uncharacterized protein YecE (DUF72 family)
LNAVEVNCTFRRIPSAETFRTWVAQTPPNFRFAIKAHQSITHYRRLQNVETLLRELLASLRPLAKAGRLGPILFQLPPNAKPNLEALENFLKLFSKLRKSQRSAPATAQAAFEFRHPGWFDEAVYAILRRHGAALCLAESDELATPEIATADFAYFRFRCSKYSRAKRRVLADKLRQFEFPVYAFFKHEERPESPLWAEEVLKLARK